MFVAEQVILISSTFLPAPPRPFYKDSGRGKAYKLNLWISLIYLKNSVKETKLTAVYLIFPSLLFRPQENFPDCIPKDVNNSCTIADVQFFVNLEVWVEAANALGKAESDPLVFDPIEIGNYMPLNKALVVCNCCFCVYC